MYQMFQLCTKSPLAIHDGARRLRVDRNGFCSIDGVRVACVAFARGMTTTPSSLIESLFVPPNVYR